MENFLITVLCGLGILIISFGLREIIASDIVKGMEEYDRRKEIDV